jgi:hypothetical protein
MTILRPRVFPARCALLLAALAAPAAADTLIVDDDGGPGVHFTDVPAAIAAASTGDVLVVRDGTYSSFTLHKALAIVADAGHAPQWGEGTAWISDVLSGYSVRLAGLTLASVRVQNCNVPVHIDDCRLEHTGATQFPAFAALAVLNCELVMVSRSHLEAADGTVDGLVVPWLAAQRGADLFDSIVVFAQCHIEGGRGGTAYKGDGQPGEPGLLAAECTLVVQSSTVRGGGGGQGWDVGGEPWVADGGDGAPGLQVSLCTLRLHGEAGDVVAGGGGGPGNIGADGAPAPALVIDGCDVGWSGVTLQAPPGAPLITQIGSLVLQAVPAVPVLRAVGSALLGSAFTLQLQGAPGAAFTLWLSPAGVPPTGAKPMPLLLFFAQLFPLTAGALDASGGAELPLAVPALPALLGMSVHFQAFVKAAGVPTSLSTAVSLVLR